MYGFRIGKIKHTINIVSLPLIQFVEPIRSSSAYRAGNMYINKFSFHTHMYVRCSKIDVLSACVNAVRTSICEQLNMYASIHMFVCSFRTANPIRGAHQKLVRVEGGMLGTFAHVQRIRGNVLVSHKPVWVRGHSRWPAQQNKQNINKK